MLLSRSQFATLLGEVLKQQRESQGLSQNDCAMLIGIDPTKLCRWEKGRLEMSVFQLLQWSRAMGCELGELVTHAAASADE